MLTCQMLKQLTPHLQSNPEWNAFAEWVVEILQQLPGDMYKECYQELMTIMVKYRNDLAEHRRQDKPDASTGQSSSLAGQSSGIGGHSSGSSA